MNLHSAENAARPLPSPTSLRLLIAGDRPRARQSLEALFTSLRWHARDQSAIQIEIVGEAKDAEQAVTQVEVLRPDVVVLDLPTHDARDRLFIAGSKLDGLSAIRTIKVRWPSVRIVVFTMYATDRSAVLLAGADVFLLKGCSTSELLAAMGHATTPDVQ